MLLLTSGPHESLPPGHKSLVPPLVEGPIYLEKQFFIHSRLKLLEEKELYICKHLLDLNYNTQDWFH